MEWLAIAVVAGIAAAALAIGFLRRRRKRYDPGGPVTDGSRPEHWLIGPVVWGENRSAGVPLHPAPHPNALFAVDLPTEPGHIHYVTFRHGPLTRKSRIVMTYRIEAMAGVRIVPLSDPMSPSILSLYFQRFGDTWTAKGEFETYRWYASKFAKMPIEAGWHQIIAPLEARWTAVLTSDSFGKHKAFREAIDNADQVGFVLGGGDGLGHGVYATGPARLVVEEFRVE